MVNSEFVLCFADHSGVRLRGISKEDIENLRVWKNRNKTTCFLNEEISPEQQQKWYEKFSRQDHDYMFVVEQKVGEDWKGIGCMGFRRLEMEATIDAYNIIRAEKFEPALFTMGNAFLLMLAYAASLFNKLPVQSKVLVNNPAVEWYQKNSFSIVKTINNYYLMELNKEVLEKINWEIKNLKK